MELVWLEDFLAVIEAGGFGRAAEQTGISQPAFSRRIRALEEWLNATLFDRTTHRVVLTPAGERFRPIAEDVLRRLKSGRDEVRAVASGLAETLRFASTHGLSLTFFPSWLRGIEYGYPMKVTVQLTSDHMVACERIMAHGQAQFLLCHHHPAAQTRLTVDQFKSIPVGSDTLLPVSAANPDGSAKHPLPGRPGAPVAHLAFTSESGLGRILAAALSHRQEDAWLDRTFSSHLVTALTAMARDGRGVAWTPASLVDQDLASGRLVRAGAEDWDVETEIRLYRPRARQSPAAEQFWAHLVSLQPGQPRPDSAPVPT